MSEVPNYLRQQWPVARQFDRRVLESSLLLVAADGATYRGWCNDISEGGLGATIAAPLQLRAEVTLQFELPLSPEPLRLRAVIRYLYGFRLGFEFLAMTPGQRQLITTFVGSPVTSKAGVR